VIGLRRGDQLGQVHHPGAQPRAANRCHQLAPAPGVYHDQEV
jgi:hypothetical protein